MRVPRWRSRFLIGNCMHAPHHIRMYTIVRMCVRGERVSACYVRVCCLASLRLPFANHAHDRLGVWGGGRNVHNRQYVARARAPRNTIAIVYKQKYSLIVTNNASAKVCVYVYVCGAHRAARTLSIKNNKQRIQTARLCRVIVGVGRERALYIHHTIAE